MLEPIGVDESGVPIKRKAVQVEGKIDSSIEGLNPTLEPIEKAVQFRTPTTIQVRDASGIFSISGTPTLITKVGQGAIVSFDNINTDLPELIAALANPSDTRFFNFIDNNGKRQVRYLNSNEVALNVDRYSLQVESVEF